MRPGLRVADVAVFYGERSGGIRTYLDAKAEFARTTGAFEHHLIVPGPRELHAGRRHELPGFPIAPANGYRFPLRTRPLLETLRAIRPQIVLLHDTCWRAGRVAVLAGELGAACAIVHHCSAEHAAAAVPGPPRIYRPLVRAWLRRSYRKVGTVLAACERTPELDRLELVPLRLGLDPAFRPRPEVVRAPHVLYVGRLAREKGVLELVEAAARSRDRWPLRLVGAGPLQAALERRCRRLRIAGRVTFRPYVRDREQLARAYAGAACVVVPAAFETFGLVTLEAAASGARVVACETSPAGRAAGGLAHRYPAGDADALLRAIDDARATPRDLAGAGALARRYSWTAAFEAELRDLAPLIASAGRSRRDG